MSVAKQHKHQDVEIVDGEGLRLLELAKLQGVDPENQLDRVTGGWPEEEREDGFEEAVARWRREDLIGRRER